jgi:hypothetical protein
MHEFLGLWYTAVDGIGGSGIRDDDRAWHRVATLLDKHASGLLGCVHVDLGMMFSDYHNVLDPTRSVPNRVKTWSPVGFFNVSQSPFLSL